MGGQACILYGGAEFSRDTDVAILASKDNIELLRSALRELLAKRIALPPFNLDYLLRGHALHFRCYHPDAMRMRIDAMSTMRGVDPFENLWERRNRFSTMTGASIDVLSLPDLVKAKKTQRDKDWPMIRRLLEADFVSDQHPSAEKVRFWLQESRTPSILLELAEKYEMEAKAVSEGRLVLSAALSGDNARLDQLIEQEERNEREIDRRYWEPLQKELNLLRGTVVEPEEDV
jgi:hypothetical protein